MKTRHGLVFFAAFGTILQGCGGDDNGTASTGGAAGNTSSDSSATGGSSGTGGTPGTGGRPDGSAATGGSGGTAGTGGGAGSGGSSDAAATCALAQYTNVFRFTGTTAEGWDIHPSSYPAAVPGTTADGATTGTAFSIDPNDGSPAPGSIKLVIPFDTVQVNEALILEHLYSMMPVNLGGTTISAQIKLDSLQGGSVTSTLQAFIALKSTSSYIYATGPTFNLEQPGQWITISSSAAAIALNGSTGFDLCDIREIDVIIQTGNAGTYGATTVHIDSIAITAGDAGVPPEPDGGTRNLDASVDGGDAAEGAASDAPAETAD
jgi:hypothetical protein